MQSQGISSYATRQSVCIRKPPELIASQFYNPQSDTVRYFSSSMQQQKAPHQIHEPISPLIPATPPPSPAGLAINHQNIQKISMQDNGIQTENMKPAERPIVQPTTGNSVVINIGMPEAAKTPINVTQENNTGAADPASGGSSSSIAPPVPLPMLPAPNGIAIPPPPQENSTPVSNTNNQNKKCCGGCGNCMSCGNCSPANKTYLIYAIIAVCASLMIALVPTIIAVMAKPKD